MKYGGGTGTFTAGPTIQGFTSNRHHCPSDGLTGINLTGTIPFSTYRRFQAIAAIRRQRRRGPDAAANREP